MRWPGRSAECGVCSISPASVASHTETESSTGPQVREGGHSAGHRRADIETETILDRHQDTSSRRQLSPPPRQ